MAATTAIVATVATVADARDLVVFGSHFRNFAFFREIEREGEGGVGVDPEPCRRGAASWLQSKLATLQS